MPKPTHTPIPQPVEVHQGACPLCGGDVRGNPRLKYLCKHCQLLFRLEDLKQ